MKKTFVIIGAAILALTSFTTNLQDGGSNSICKSFFPLEKGTELTYENYNKKEKLESTDFMKITDIIEEAGKTTIKVHTASQDKKGEEISTSDFEYICENGVFKISMESIVDEEMMEAYKDMDVVMEQNELELPADMEVGQTLPDADIAITITSNGMQVMKMKFDITERKVEAIEDLTTDAGTFECYKLSQNTTAKILFMTKTYKTVEWLSENVGSVRSETYSETGKLQSYRVLKSIKR